MNAIIILLLLVLALWLDVVLYRWLRKRYPTLAKVLLILWIGSGLLSLYRFANRPGS